MKRRPVRDLMSDELVSVELGTPLSEVVNRLAASRLRSVPVVDAAGTVVGIISEIDLFLSERSVAFSTEKVPTLLGRIIDEHQLEHLDRAKSIPVEQVMHREVETATEETTLEEAAMKMMRLAVSSLPVVRDGKLVGIVRRIDILHAIFHNEPPDIDEER